MILFSPNENRFVLTSFADLGHVLQSEHHSEDSLGEKLRKLDPKKWQINNKQTNKRCTGILALQLNHVIYRLVSQPPGEPGSTAGAFAALDACDRRSGSGSAEGIRTKIPKTTQIYCKKDCGAKSQGFEKRHDVQNLETS